MSTIKKGSTNVSRYIMLRDSTAGTPETAYTITSLDLQYTRSGAAPAAKVDATALAATDSAHGDNQAIQIDATSSPGLYRVDWPDAAFATGVDKVILVVSGAGLDPCVEEIELVSYDPEDGVRLGLTAIPNAAADAAGGLPISDAGGLDVDAIKTKTDYLPSATAGAAGGVFIAGTNAPVTIANAGGDALTLTSSGGNGCGLKATGEGSGEGIKGIGGGTVGTAGIRGLTTATLATGIIGEGSYAGIQGLADSSSNGFGILAVGYGTGHGVFAMSGAGATGNGIHAESLATNGNGMALVGIGTGSDLLADITGDITGTLATVTTYTGNTVQTGDSYAVVNSGTYGNAAIKTETAVIVLDTNELQADDVPGLIAALNNVSAADVNAQCDTALTDYDGPTNSDLVARTIPTASYFDPATDAVANVTLVATTTTNTDLVTAAVIADAVWDEAAADHVAAGSFGKTDADILADTNELQGNQAAWATATGFATSSALTTHDGKLDTLDTLVDRIATTTIGTISDAGTGTEIFVYAGVTATITVDASGNRSAVVFS